MKPSTSFVICCVCSLWLLGCSSPQATPKTEAPRALITGVSVDTLGPQPITETLEAIGTVTSVKQSVLSAKTVATVVAVHVRAGERVRAGQVVIELDDRETQARLRKAQASRQDAQSGLADIQQAIVAAEKAREAAAARQELAQATLDRYASLLARHSVAPQEYDEVAAQSKTASAEVMQALAVRSSLVAKKRQMQAKIEQAEAEVAQARIALGDTQISVPLDGIVAAKHTEAGNVTTPGAPLLTLESPRYVLEAAVRESDIRQVQIGQQGTVHIDALGQDFACPVVEIVPLTDALSRTFTVKLALPAEPELRSGLYGKARFVVGQRAAIVVPRAALVEQGQLEGVFVLDQGDVASLRLVKTGKGHDNGIEILSGLETGERVVVAGTEKVFDGGQVRDAI